MTNILFLLCFTLLVGCTANQDESNNEPIEPNEEQETPNKIDDYRPIPATVYFDKPIRTWDGFGVNYVETSQTFDYEAYPQDYGGFRFLSEAARDSIIHLTFAEDGLKPGLVKMFLDPMHQKEEGGTFDHETTTGSMRYFVKEGLQLTQQRGQDLEIITTLYGPPAYITQQNELRGRDIDPAQKENLANYMIDWAGYLVENDFPLKYISIHNEGESWRRWPTSGKVASTVEEGHDYNLFWEPEMVADMINIMRPILDKRGLTEIGVTCGEYTNWYRFPAWGYALAIFDNKEALQNLGMISSHGFYVGSIDKLRWFGPHSGRGQDLLRSERPELHAWCTSTAWDSKNDELDERRYIMESKFVKEIHGNIYEAKVNGLIPWALIQTKSQWNKPDPNPGSAFRVYDDGSWEVQKGYYFFKQVSRAGQPGMQVVHTTAMDSEIALIGFDNGDTDHSDALVVVNFGDQARDLQLEFSGSETDVYQAFRTTGQEVYRSLDTADKNPPEGENYQSIGEIKLTDNKVIYEAPAGSVTTFFAVD